MAFPEPTWLVGCGNMAGAMVAGWRAAGVDLSAVTAIRPSGMAVEGVRTVNALPDEPAPALVLLGFKPQKLDEVAPGLAGLVGPDAILVSMLAGVTVETLAARFTGARSIVRIMPNLPVAQVQGVTALYTERAEEADRAVVGGLMARLGMTRWCEDEEQFSTIGAIAGSGPAYFARFTAALAAGGEELGLTPAVARSIAIQTLVGTGAMAAATIEEMDDLARRVASPKGTTEAGLAVLDAPGGLRALIAKMLAASLERGRDLAQAARRG